MVENRQMFLVELKRNQLWIRDDLDILMSAKNKASSMYIAKLGYQALMGQDGQRGVLVLVLVLVGRSSLLERQGSL